MLCGSIQVPLYRKAPSLGAPLTVRFRVYRHTDHSLPPLEPVVADEGGPGISSTGSASTYLYMLGPLHRRHDLILMDNRGTGLSGAVNCTRLQQGIGDFTGATGACARHLGVAANAYGTGAAADDLKDILDVLHVGKVDVYGDSYGTYFAQTFAVRSPGQDAGDRARRRILAGRIRPVGAERVDRPARGLAGGARALGQLQQDPRRDHPAGRRA